MAPEFSKNMYKIYQNKYNCKSLICSYDFDLFDFRNKLEELTLKNTNFFVYKIENGPFPIDSNYIFFKKSDYDKVMNFYNSKSPGIISWIFKGRKWKNFKIRENEINTLKCLEFFTSHDHPCIEIYSWTHNEEKLATLINNSAEALNITIENNHKLDSMEKIIRSNRLF